MSKETRNTRNQRKSVKSPRYGGDPTPRKRRADGTRAPNLAGRPRSPKKGRAQAQSGENHSSGHDGDAPHMHTQAQNRSNQGAKRGAKRGPKQGHDRGHAGGSGWIYGAHACLAALSNPKRTIHQIMVTDTALPRYEAALPDNAPPPKLVLPGMIDRQLSGKSGAPVVHQGIAMKCAPLEWPDIDTIAEHAGDDGLILVLDQITDPHNVGAMLRLASAFGVSALVMQDRKAPPLTGATAKVAVGCVESVPVCLVTNVANTLLGLQKQNWMVTGLAGETELSLGEALSGGGRRVIVMGAEGPGLRDRVKSSCDQLARIPMMSAAVPGQAESLNVATAAGIALYEARQKR